MPAHRANVTELGRLLNRIAQPVYVLDEELTIVFANRACLDWLGPTADGIIGTRCVYHSAPPADGPEVVASGLCPPPTVLDGETCRALIGAEGSLPGQRYARFLPLAAEGDVFGVVAIVESGRSTAGFRRRWRSLRRPARSRRRAAAEPVALHDCDSPISSGIRGPVSVRSLDRPGACHALGPPAGRVGGRQPGERSADRSRGSGRQHLAAAIHYAAAGSRPLAASQAAQLLGNVQDAALLPLDCSLLAADLVEAVLAAVGRASQRSGADQPGTLLLHRVDELAADVQVQLADLLGPTFGPLAADRNGRRAAGRTRAAGRVPCRVGRLAEHDHDRVAAAGRAARRPAALGPTVPRRPQCGRIAADRRLFPSGPRPARRLLLAGQPG